MRSPYQGLLGYVDLLSRDFEVLDKNEIRPIIDDINKMLNCQYNLLEKLLDWANLQRGKSRFFVELINTKNTINDVIEILKLNIGNKEIELKKYND